MGVVSGIYILLGSNLGSRLDNLSLARQYLSQEAGSIIAASAVYETEAWGVESQPLFLNQVVQLSTTVSHEPLLGILQEIERKIGKVKIGKWRERLIDIDLLYYGPRLVRTPTLTLPHPEIQNRRFALAPLAELIPEERHPVLLRTHRQLLQETTDPLKVWKISAVGG
ncbi:MAG: 2-amino-4-hydroxy-6-hydroxymethyldihydropteridine diphosphokinase [Cyclobacteriaceae bacterium]